MGDVIPFPTAEERARRNAPASSGLTLYCSSCGQPRDITLDAPDPGTCSCGGCVFTSLPNFAGCYVQRFPSPFGTIEVVSPPGMEVTVDPGQWGGWAPPA